MGAWRYCEASVLYIWGDATGDRDVDRLVAAVRQAGAEGLSVTDANDTVFKGHKPVGPIAARAVRYGLVRREQQVTNGRTREVFFARVMTDLPMRIKQIMRIMPHPGNPRRPLIRLIC